MVREISFLIGIAFLLFISCRKIKNQNSVDQLPPATSKGANTFGCLVDGKVFLPYKDLLAGGVVLQCNYQQVQSENYFVLAARNQKEEYMVVVNIDKLELTKDTNFSFSSPLTGPVYGRTGKSQTNFTLPYRTNGTLPGMFSLSRFDLVNQIAAGTFWFDAIDSATGKIVQVREGRFDVQFTQ